MSASPKKSAAAKAPAKAPIKPSVKKATAALPATKTPAKVPARKVQAPVPAKTESKAPAKRTSREAMLARVEAVRLQQRGEGNFDCFGRAAEGYCDQGSCAFHAECLSVSRLLHSL